MKRGDFVTAKLKGKDDCRQGILISADQRSFLILGESGVTYACEESAVVVPDENLWGSTKRFVDSWRG